METTKVDFKEKNERKDMQPKNRKSERKFVMEGIR
jgi:hypothetical protein